jgi:hypothetical protein
MLMFVLIGVCLVLVGIAGLEFTYLFYVERLYRERQKHLQMLERKCSRLAEKLDAAETRVREQSDFIALMCPEGLPDEETWSDIIEDR